MNDENGSDSKIDHSARDHARLGASSSSQWIACPGSIQMQEKFYAENPDAEERDRGAADEGSFAHEVADWCIENDTRPLTSKCHKYFTDNNKGNYNLDEVLQNVAKYFQYVKGIMEGVKNYKRFHEVRVDFSQWVDGGFGTLDLGFVSADTIYIFDLKYGKGRVQAKDNSQLMLYALGLYAEQPQSRQMNIHNFQLNICQPRISNFSWDNIYKDDFAGLRHTCQEMQYSCRQPRSTLGSWQAAVQVV